MFVVPTKVGQPISTSKTMPSRGGKSPAWKSWEMDEDDETAGISKWGATKRRLDEILMVCYPPVN